MAVSQTIVSSRIAMRLDVGTSESGNVITKSVSLPGVKEDPTLDNVMNVVNSLEPILRAEVYDVRKTTTTTLNE